MPFLCAGSNVRRQNAAQWVNLQLLQPRSCHEHQSPALLFFPTTTPSHPCPPCPELLLTCAISQLVQDEPPGQPLVLSSQGSIVSLTPCVLCLHHFVEQILPQRMLPSAPPVEFSITSHIRDTLWWVPPQGPGPRGYRVSEMRAANLCL